ncbi:hypothetical protein B296_00035215 [Ensete ventricosum]|uniref:Uncharacterized protein n=1 Tax=Ensete ventricosum TaxID=4639 RepID=A0A426Z6X2_ENSVE|nr:hypothetical protein B296_00035215 [Ensete ventricosum]
MLATVDVGVSTIEKHPSSDAEAGLRKHLRKAAAEQPADTSGCTVRTSTDKGKGTVELREIPERGYTMRELCEVEDQVRVDKYFTSIMTRLKCIKGEDPLVPRWSTISGSSPLWTVGPLSREYLRGALNPTLAKQAANKELKASVGQELAAAAEQRVKELEAEIERMRTKLESLKSQRRELEQEVRLLRSNLDGARNDRARLEGDILLLTEVAALLEAELKVKGQKAVAAYKGSRGFESSLKKIGRVNYEFRYRVALERLRGKHPDIMIELDPFAECPEDANIEMDLD